MKPNIEKQMQAALADLMAATPLEREHKVAYAVTDPIDPAYKFHASINLQHIGFGPTAADAVRASLEKYESQQRPVAVLESQAMQLGYKLVKL